MPGHHGQSGTSMGVSQGGSTGHTGHPSAGVGGNNNQPAKTTTVPSGINIHRDTGIEEKPYVISGGKKHYKTGVDEEGNPSTVYNTEIQKSQNIVKAHQEKKSFWEQVTNAASDFVESGGLIGNVIKLGGNVLSKLGEYSSELQKKAMTYSLNNKITAIGKKDDFHPGAYGYKIQDIQKDIDAIEKGDFTQSDFNEKYGSPEISVGGGDGQDRDLMNMVAPVAPYAVGGTTPQDSVAAKWYASLGNNNNNNAFGFSFQKEYNAAKQKQAGILGSPSSVGMLAVNNSPFYNFLKERNLNKGIL